MSGSSSSVVMSDNQGSIAAVMRLPEDYDSRYYGQAGTLPVSLVPRNANGKFELVELGAPQRGDIDPLLVSFLPVPRGSKLCIWFPVIKDFLFQGASGASYTYTFVWRMRSLKDHRFDSQASWSLHRSYSLDNAGLTGKVNAVPLPAAIGPVVSPVLEGVDVSMKHLASGWTGDLAVANYGSTQTHYRPEIITALGDEMGIIVHKVSPYNWGFGHFQADEDFAATYGHDSFHPDLPWKGLYVYSMIGGV